MTASPLHAKILSVPAAPQAASPLFGVLPAEMRSYIFSLALTDYPDPAPDKQYATATCYSRPHYFAPRKSDTALLRTCRAVYTESWFLPFVLREQTHWLTTQDRAPPEYVVDDARRARRQGRGHSLRLPASELEFQLWQIQQQRGSDEPPVEIEALRVFAQMFKLEEGGLARLLKTPGLRPRRLTLTIRHADWWYWESDEPLRFEAGWIPAVCEVLPSSVREFCFELESLERKKDQVDAIAKQMRERWFFRRTDGASLYADAAGGNAEVSRWSGKSTWHNKRWVRDETEPGRIDYYVVSVPFRLQHVVERAGGRVSDEARQAAEAGAFDAKKLKLHIPGAKRIEVGLQYMWDGPWHEGDGDGLS